jgi:DNA-binding LytR/AlgR family response regulator
MQRLKILIVEDETITAMDIRETLEGAGHVVTDTAYNYEDALSSIRVNVPDLAIIDVKLNHSAADGIVLAKEIHLQYHIPIIFLTANSESKTVQRAKEVAPSAYLLKPFRPEELLIQIDLAWSFFKEKQMSFERYLFFPIQNKGHKRIDLNDVLYIKAAGSYTEIYVATEPKEFVVSTNLSNLSQYFSSPNFFRLSRSLLVNLEQIDSIEAEKLHMKAKAHAIDISPNNRKELLAKLKTVKTKAIFKTKA